MVDLTGANLTGANLVAARLTSALYTTATRWPDNFNPESHGALLVTEKPQRGPGWWKFWQRG